MHLSGYQKLIYVPQCSTGLCGNFNNIMSDDFRVISGLVEGTAAAFANTWKTRVSCPDVVPHFGDPCSQDISRGTDDLLHTMLCWMFLKTTQIQKGRQQVMFEYLVIKKINQQTYRYTKFQNWRKINHSKKPARRHEKNVALERLQGIKEGTSEE